ncbi:MAG: leucine-rich repeat protein [Firmicutes bacterium]|nr:leucine-rich repeat protein [Bacillota bacterium]
MQIKPKQAEYRLESGAEGTLEVQNDGKTLKAVRNGNFIVKIYAVSGGERRAEATVNIFLNRPTEGGTVDPLDKFKVIFHTFGKGGVADQLVNPGGKADAPMHVEFGGEAVASWHTDSDLGTETEFNFANTVILENITLYAKWVPKNNNPELLYKEVNGETFVLGLMFPTVGYTEVKIPEFSDSGKPIKGIASRAFNPKDRFGNEISLKIEWIVIPESVETIEEYAFFNLRTLKTLDFDGSSKLKHIERNAFSNCENLEGLSLPQNLESLGTEAFLNCKKIDIAELPIGIVRLNARVFSNTYISRVDLSEITVIEREAFLNTQRLATVVNADKVNELQFDAFRGTSWYTAERTTARQNGTNLVTLKDKNGEPRVVVECVLTPPSNNFEVTIPPQIVLIGGSAFPSSSFSQTNGTNKGYISFSGTVPPRLGQSAFAPGLVLSVPRALLTEYRNAFGNSYINQIYFRDLQNDTDLFIAPHLASGEMRVILYKFNNAQASRLDMPDTLSKRLEQLKGELDIFNGIHSYRIVKVARHALADLPNLAQIVFPAKTDLFETYSIHSSVGKNVANVSISFTDNLNIKREDFPTETAFANEVRKQVSASNHERDSITIGAGTGNNTEFLIFVPLPYLSVYRTAWNNYHNNSRQLIHPLS